MMLYARLRLATLVLVMLGFAAAAHARVTILENFESYATTVELEAAWVDAGLGSPVQSLDTTGLLVGSNSLRIDYDTADMQDERLDFTFPVPFDFDHDRVIVLFCRNLAGNTEGDVWLQLRGASGLGSPLVLPGGTVLATDPNGPPGRWEMTVPYPAGTKSGLRITIKAHAGGAGTLFLDAIAVLSGTYGSCRGCHGKFDASSYTARTDQQIWSGGLMSTHAGFIPSDECAFCHTYAHETEFPSRYYPVELDASEFGEPGGCVMCHGRAEDEGLDGASRGWAAGLRRHHHRTIKPKFGIPGGECFRCHSDATTGPLAEELVLPQFHLTATGPPSDPCDGSEHIVSPVYGLDNDGDDLYEWEDLGCYGVVDTDGDNLYDAVDVCPEYANVPPIDDTNGDGVPDVCQCGDANEDGNLTNADVTLLLQCVAGGTGCNPDLADADGNGTLGTVDAALVNQVVSGALESSTLTCARRPVGAAAAQVFGLFHVGTGGATLSESGGSLVVSGIGTDGEDGTGWDLGDETVRDLWIEVADVDPSGTLPNGASLRAKLMGEVDGASPAQLALVSMDKTDVGFELSLNASTIGALSYRYEIRLAGEVVASTSAEAEPVEASAAATTIRARTAGLPAGIEVHWLWDAPVALTLPYASPVVGDELRMIPEDASALVSQIESVELRLASIAALTIEQVSSASSVPALSVPSLLVAGALAALGLEILYLVARTRRRRSRRMGGRRA